MTEEEKRLAEEMQARLKGQIAYNQRTTPSANPNEGVTNPSDWVMRDPRTGGASQVYDDGTAIVTEPVQNTHGYYQIPVGEEPQKPEGYGDYNWYGDFVGQYMNPLTNEERARRERAAYITSGVQNLGKAFGALGNMFAARNGAPAQQPVKVEDADKRVNAFREYADKERNAYLSAKLQRQKLIDDAYDKDWTRWYNSVKANNSMASTMEALEIKRMKQQIDAHKADLQAQLMAARIRGEEAKAKKLETELAYWNDITLEKLATLKGLASQRYAAAERNAAMRDKHIHEMQDKTVTTTSTDRATGMPIVTTRVTSYGTGTNGGSAPAASNASTNTGTGGVKPKAKGGDKPKAKGGGKSKVKGENTKKLGL